jgi:WS/DGAT/MGAT family acyltransferase
VTPSGAELLAQALLDRVSQPAELVRPVRALLRRPARVLEAARDQAIGLGAFAWAGLTPAPPTPYNHDTVGRDRRFAWVRGSLDDFKAVKNSWDGSVNDVVLTVVARALRRHLRRRGEDVDGLTLKAFVPVSTRQSGDETGNRVTGMIAPLPIGCEHARECFDQIRAEMGEIKSSGQAVGARALTELSGFAPPTLLSQGARLIGRQRFINLVVTNVPGPQEALYLGDRELLDVFPMVPLGKNLTFNVAIVSYNGRMDFGLIGDFDTMSDLNEVADDFVAALDEVRTEAGTEQAAATRSSESLEPTGAEEVRQAIDPESGHVDTPVELVAEQADPGAEEGAGPAIHVEEPWPGYDQMTTAELIDRLHEASDEGAAVVDLYERMHRDRPPIREAAARALSRPG